MRHAQFTFGAAKGPFGHGAQNGGPRGRQDAPDTTVPDPVAETPVTGVTYSDQVVAELIYMIEEEKLAGDVYEAFHEMYGLNIFKNIGASEDNHFNALIGQAQALGLDTDQFVFAEAGQFDDPELQELYDTLVQTGSVSLTSALEVGVAIETKDMVDIAAAIEDVEGTSLAGVYENLLAGSENHLVAFEGLLA